MNYRLDFIDMAKGFAIMLMVYGHTFSKPQYTSLMIWIYSFHMPLFFLTSGILYGIKSKRELHIGFKWKSKILTLLLPYFLWNTIYQLFISVLSILGGKPIRRTLVSNLLMVFQLQGSAMWFLPVMFLAAFFFLLTVKKKVLNILSAFIFFIFGIFFTECNIYFDAILKSFIGTVFITLGFYGYKAFIKEVKIYQLVFLFIISVFTVRANGMVSIASRDYNHPLLYILNGFLGTLIIYQLIMRLRRIKFIYNILKCWGENSVKILCFHSFIIEIIRLIDYKALGNILPQFGMFEGIILTMLVMTILTVLMPVINKFLNWSFGIKNRKREQYYND